MENFSISVGNHKMITLQEVLYLKGCSNYTYLFLHDGRKFLVCHTLKELEGRFGSLGFFRTHRSLLVNANFIKSYSSSFEGGTITLCNDEELTVSRRRNRILKTSMLLLSFT